MELRGKVALVTGAGSGIGRASASRLARAGVKVGLLGRTADQLETAAEDIRRAGGDAMVLVADVAESDQMQRAVADLVVEVAFEPVADQAPDDEREADQDDRGERG